MRQLKKFNWNELFPGYGQREWSENIIQSSANVRNQLCAALVHAEKFSEILGVSSDNFKAFVGEKTKEWRLLEEAAWKIQGRQMDGAANKVFGRTFKSRDKSVLEGQMEEFTPSKKSAQFELESKRLNSKKKKDLKRWLEGKRLTPPEWLVKGE